MIRIFLAAGISLFSTLQTHGQSQTSGEPLGRAGLASGSLYLPSDRLTVEKEGKDDQLYIRLALSNQDVKVGRIEIIMESSADRLPALVSDDYEIFLTKSSLSLTKHRSGQKWIFQVGDDYKPKIERKPMRKKVLRPIHVIGITTYFRSCPAPQF